MEANDAFETQNNGYHLAGIPNQLKQDNFSHLG